MGIKTLTNVRCLEDLISRAPAACLRSFAHITECRSAFSAVQWPDDDRDLASHLLETVRRLRKEQLTAAEEEAARIERASCARGAQVLWAVAEQLNDNDLFALFAAQPGGELGRAIWMRSHSATSRRLFEVAESIIRTGEARGGKKLYDAYEIPCEAAPPFLWTSKVKAALEAELAKAMKLESAPEVVHIEMVDAGPEGSTVSHYLVVRFAGSQIGAVKVEQGRRENFWYYPARDATLVYTPGRRCVEAFAHNLALRAPMANALATHGFKVPLSNRPLNRARYDLTAFARPLKDRRPKLACGKVERLYLTEAKALLGHASDTVKLEISSGADLHEVIAQRWGNHPFVAQEMLIRVTLAAEVVFDGQTQETPMSITVGKPGRCSLQGERDPQLRLAGEQLLEYLGVRHPIEPGGSEPNASFLLSACRLLELAQSPIDGFALSEMGVDIEVFANEGVLIEGERITQREVESAPGMVFSVPIERCADGVHVRYRDPTTGLDVLQPASLARRWSVNLPWLRETLLNALGESLTGTKGAHLDDDPVFMGEMQIDGREVALYFASRMGSERSYRKVDSALRLRPRPQPGIVLTSSFTPLPFAGTNVVIPIEEVLTAEHGRPCIDQAALEVAYRAGQLAARGGSSVALQVSPDRQSGMLTIPGLAPWLITGPMRIVALERLVQAHATGPGHVVTKVLLRDTGCDSLDGLFGADSRWRTYIERVEGTRAWRLRTEPTAPVDTEPANPDDESAVKDSESVDAVDEADATQSLK